MYISLACIVRYNIITIKFSYNGTFNFSSKVRSRKMRANSEILEIYSSTSPWNSSHAIFFHFLRGWVSILSEKYNKTFQGFLRNFGLGQVRLSEFPLKLITSLLKSFFQQILLRIRNTLKASLNIILRFINFMLSPFRLSRMYIKVFRCLLLIYRT